MSNEEKTVMFAMPNLLTGHLACVGGTMSGRSWELTAGTFTIGRLDDHDMCLSAEPGVSKTHAKIMGQGDHYIIVDAESRNGTLVNGQPVQKAELFDGDEIRICGCLLRFTQVGGRPRRVPVAAAADHGPPTAAFVQPPIPMASPPPAITGPQFTAPQPLPSGSMAPTAAMPMAAPMVPAAPMAMSIPAPSTGKVLAAWYAAGLAASLLLGGGASAALIATTEDPAVAVATPPEAGPTTPTTAPTDAAPTPPPAPAPTPEPAAAVDAGVAVTEPTPTPPEPTPTPPEPTPAPAATPEPPAPPPAPVQVAATEDPVEEAPVEERRRRPTSTSGNGPFAASVESGGVEVLKSRSGGRVKTTVSDGATVAKGTVIVTFETSADAGEIATLQDRISSLEGVEGEEAKRDLKAAKQKLAALQGAADAAPVIATIDGVVQGLLVSPGTIVRAGEPIGRVVDTSVTPRVKVSVPRSLRPKSGQKVMMNLKSGGSISGTVVAVSGRSVLIDPGSEAAENIESVGF